ncbi:hypothetical protein J2857_003832 [Neorhizobium galegae]|nr:hypothetical protein [Neorhizobium galegae]
MEMPSMEPHFGFFSSHLRAFARQEEILDDGTHLGCRAD